MERIETIIVGGGPAGLATSYHLTQRGREHVVLEQAAQPAIAWRYDRWDSFRLVTPNWSFRLPGAPYDGPDHHGFLSRDDVVATFDRYVERFNLPIRCDSTVTAVEPRADGGYLVKTKAETIEAANVVIATGFFQQPKTPPFAADLPSGIVQLHSSRYRNPESLPAGAVLVVGSAQSGCQIAEELRQSGRTVFLATGGAGRVPRRYRGKDIIDWLDQVGLFDLTSEQLPPGMSKFGGIPQLSGANGGHTLNLHRFARDGITLLGRMRGAAGHRAYFVPDLHENLTRVDGFEREVVGAIDGHIREHGLDAPIEALPDLRDGFEQTIVEQLDLRAAGVGVVIWAMGYIFDYGLVKLPVHDADGFPIQTGGVTAFPGLYFVGMPWMPTERSGFLLGVGDTAGRIAAHLDDAAAPRRQVSASRVTPAPAAARSND